MKTHQTTSEVYKAIINVMSEIGAISKSRKNAQQGYSFRGVDDVLNSLQPLLVKNNLIIIPYIVERKETEKATKNGGTMLHVVVQMKYDMISAIDGSTVISLMAGEAMDSGDKATNKAMSTAYKYFAFQTFCIPTDEPKDTENDSPEIANKAVEVKTNPVVNKDDDGKDWLNLYNKNGSPNDKGEAAKKFIREGGKVADIAKKYKLSKAVKEELMILENQISHIPSPAKTNPSSNGVNEYDVFGVDDTDYQVY